MTLNMLDPASIAAWYKSHPKRHGPMLRLWLRNPLWSAFWPAIAASRELVK